MFMGSIGHNNEYRLENIDKENLYPLRLYIFSNESNVHNVQRGYIVTTEFHKRHQIALHNYPQLTRQ